MTATLIETAAHGPAVAAAPGPLLRQVAEQENLARAWEHLRDRDAADGVLTAGVDSFARRASARLATMSSDLLSGTWRPGPLTRIDIAKPEGGSRRLGIPGVADRIVERSIVQVLNPVIDPWFSPWSFAYRPGLGVADALRAVVTLRNEGRRWVVLADFRQCFDRLSRRTLVDDLATRLDRDENGDLVQLVTALLARPERVRRRLVPTSLGTTQGGPLSPLLCNLLLTRFDSAMLGRGWPAVRYADDMAIVVRNEKEAVEALGAAKEEAARIALDLADDKTEVVSFSEGFVFLGEDVNHKYPEELPHELRHVPDRRTLYLGRQGSTVRLRQGQVVVSDRDNDLLSVPSSLVGQVVCFGSVMLTPAVVAHAGKEGWSVVWMSRRGWLHGWIEGPSPVRVDLRRKQYRLSDSEEFRLDLARRLVAGKVANQRRCWPGTSAGRVSLGSWERWPRSRRHAGMP